MVTFVQQETQSASGKFTEPIGFFSEWCSSVALPQCQAAGPCGGLCLTFQMPATLQISALSLHHVGLEGFSSLFSLVGCRSVPASHLPLARPLHLVTRSCKLSSAWLPADRFWSNLEPSALRLDAPAPSSSSPLSLWPIPASRRLYDSHFESTSRPTSHQVPWGVGGTPVEGASVKRGMDKTGVPPGLHVCHSQWVRESQKR